MVTRPIPLRLFPHHTDYSIQYYGESRERKSLKMKIPRGKNHKVKKYYQVLPLIPLVFLLRKFSFFQRLETNHQEFPKNL